MRALPAIFAIAVTTGVACSEPVVRLPSRTTPSGPHQPPYEDDVPIDGIAWADMDMNQRAKYMADVVTPTMRTLFVDHDPSAYKEGFGCATCHGHNATEVGFAMPNGLSPLDPEALPSPGAKNPERAKWASFMITKVTPQMAELLGKEPSRPGSTSGFGCFDCHARAE